MALVIVGAAWFYIHSRKISVHPIDDTAAIINTGSTTACSPNSPAWVKIISPNGGQTYTPGQQMTITWQKCNFPVPQVSIMLKSYQGLLVNQHSFAPQANTGTFSVVLPVMPTGQYKMSVSAQLNSSTVVWDESDMPFTIAYTPATFSMTVPQYVLTSCGLPSCHWPPVITVLKEPYLCKVGVVPNTDGNDVTAQRVVQNKTYCVHTVSEGYAGGQLVTYTYTKANTGGGTKTTTFSAIYTSCGTYGTPGTQPYDQCHSNQMNFGASLDAIVNSLM
jgi:hypothetical protein